MSIESATPLFHLSLSDSQLLFHLWFKASPPRPYLPLSPTLCCLQSARGVTSYASVPFSLAGSRERFFRLALGDCMITTLQLQIFRLPVLSQFRLRLRRGCWVASLFADLTVHAVGLVAAPSLLPVLLHRRAKSEKKPVKNHGLWFQLLPVAVVIAGLPAVSHRDCMERRRPYLYFRKQEQSSLASLQRGVRRQHAASVHRHFVVRILALGRRSSHLSQLLSSTFKRFSLGFPVSVNVQGSVFCRLAHRRLPALLLTFTLSSGASRHTVSVLSVIGVHAEVLTHSLSLVVNHIPVAGTIDSRHSRRRAAPLNQSPSSHGLRRRSRAARVHQR